MRILAANNAASTLATAVLATDVTIQLSPGGGTEFPNPVVGEEYFVGTLTDRLGVLREIVNVTARAGDVLTVDRAQEGTAGLAWPAGSRLLNLITAGSLLAAARSLHDPRDIIALTADTILTAEDSGNTYSNDGALEVIEISLPIGAPEGTQYTFLSVVDLAGIGFVRPEIGVFISYNGQMGVKLVSYTKGSSCELVQNNESEWTVVSADPPEAWILIPATENELSSEIVLWRNAVRASGGEPDNSTLVAYDQFLHSHQHFGTYGKVVDWAMLWKLDTEDPAVSFTTLKLRLQLQINNASFSSGGLGYELDGSSQNISWPAPASVYGPGIMNDINQRLELYTYFSMAKNAQAIGSSDGLHGMGIRPLQGVNMRVTFGSRTADFPLPPDPLALVPSGGGLSVGSRDTRTVIEGYRNGVKLGAITVLPMNDGLCSSIITLGSNNSNGVFNNYVNCALTYAAFGAKFTEAEEAINWRILSRLIARFGAKFITPTTPDDNEE
jgi:hypothetical protein